MAIALLTTASAEVIADDVLGPIEWRGQVSSRFSPGVTAVPRQPGSVEPRFDIKLRVEMESEYLEFSSLARLLRNPSARYVTGPDTVASLFGPSGLYMGSGWLTVKPVPGVKIYAGRFHGKFGAGWILVSDLFDPFSGDYEQTERVGYGIEVALPEVPVLGEMRLALENFYADYSSGVSATRNVPYPYDSGPPYLRFAPHFGPASTGRLDNYTVSLRSGVPRNGLFWQLSLTHEATGYAVGAIETGTAATVSYTTPVLDSEGRLTAYAELARFENLYTTPGLGYSGFNSGLILEHGPWEFDTMFNRRQVDGTYHRSDVQIGIGGTRNLGDVLLPGVSVGIAGQYTHIVRFDRYTLFPYIQYSVNF
jgi:hypothetical protein